MNIDQHNQGSLPTETSVSKQKELAQIRLLCQLYENGLLKICIVDERVHRYYQNDRTEELAMMGIYFPPYFREGDKLFNMNSGKTVILPNKGLVEGSIGFSPDPSSEEDHKYDVMIIHQGILDKLYNDLPLPNVNTAIRKAINKFKMKIPYVIITSGRGEPEQLPVNTRFITYSSLQSIIMSSHPEKMLLTQLLMKVSTNAG